METVLSSWYLQYKTLRSKDSSKLSNSSSAVQGGFMNITEFRRIGFGFGRRWFICFNVGLCVWVCGFSFFFWRLPLFLFALSCYFPRPVSLFLVAQIPTAVQGKMLKASLARDQALLSGIAKGGSSSAKVICHCSHPSSSLSQPQGWQRLVHKGFFGCLRECSESTEHYYSNP